MTIESIKIRRFKTFRVSHFDKKTFLSFFVHYVHVKNCVLYAYNFSTIHDLIDMSKFKRKHVLKASPRFTAPRESFSVEFVVIKHFGRESLHVEPSCGLDVVKYMLKCVFC